MAHYRHKDVESILNLFELELSSLNKLSRVEKMKIRRRVANAVTPALSACRSKPDIFLNIIELKLRDVFSLFFDGWGFRQTLRQQVDSIIKERKKKIKAAG